MIKPYFKNLNRESLAASFKSLSTIYEHRRKLIEGTKEDNKELKYGKKKNETL